MNSHQWVFFLSFYSLNFDTHGGVLYGFCPHTVFEHVMHLWHRVEKFSVRRNTFIFSYISDFSFWIWESSKRETNFYVSANYWTLWTNFRPWPNSWPQNESFANFCVYLIESTMHVWFQFSFFSFHCFGLSLKYETADKIYFYQNDSLVRFFSKASVYSQISTFQKVAAKIAMTPVPRSLISISVQKKQKYTIEKKKCTWTFTTFTALCCIQLRQDVFHIIHLERCFEL